jgi:SAM-dependent methyltransferase
MESGTPRAAPEPGITADAPMLPRYYRLLDAIPETHWRYVARHELFLQLWASHREVHARYRVLDIGCGSGGLLAYVAGHSPSLPVGVDLFPDTLVYCHRRGIRNVSAAAATTLPFADGVFDFVVAQDVVEHVRDDAAALAEMFRVCAPGGIALVLVPAFRSLWSSRDLRLGHYRRYTLAEIGDGVASAGFLFLRRTYTDLLLFPVLRATVALAPRGLDGVPEVNLDAPGGKGLVNRALLALSRLEAAWVRRASLPFGVSAVVLARKPSPGDRGP